MFPPLSTKEPSSTMQEIFLKTNTWRDQTWFEILQISEKWGKKRFVFETHSDGITSGPFHSPGESVCELVDISTGWLNKVLIQTCLLIHTHTHTPYIPVKTKVVLRLTFNKRSQLKPYLLLFLKRTRGENVIERTFNRMQHNVTALCYILQIVTVNTGK